MASSATTTTIMSTKGQVILPKRIRDQLNWAPGTRLSVESGPDGVTLRAAPLFAPTSHETVFASLAYKGPPKSLAEMEEAVVLEAKRRNARDRH